MKVLVASFGFAPEKHGVANVATAVAYGLHERGHEVTVATRADALRKDFAFPAGLEVVEFAVDGFANPREPFRGEVDRYVDFIGAYRGDVLLLNCWQIWTSALAFRAFCRTPAAKVLVSQGISANSTWTWPRSLPTWLLWRPWVHLELPRCIRMLDRLVLPSRREDRDRFYDHRVARRIGYDRISFIPNGVHVPAGLPPRGGFRAAHGIGDRPLVVCVGGFSDLKNQALVLDAFLAAEVPGSLLVLLGPTPNDYSRALERRAARVRGRAEVRFLYGLSDGEVAQANRDADVAASGSRTEYFPLVVLEAMAAGTPWVHTDVGCVSDLPGGRVIRSRSGMADALRELLGDAPLRARLGAGGRASCEAQYDWPHVLDLYEQMMLGLRP